MIKKINNARMIFILYLNYVKSLKFKERLNYFKLRKLFKDLYIRINYSNHNLFDWNAHSL